MRGLAQAARQGRLPVGGQPAPSRRLAGPGRRHAGLGGPRSSTASPSAWTNSPGPGGPVTGTLRRCSPVGEPGAAGGWPSRTWSSGPSAPARDCPPPQPCSWSGPGTHGRPGDTSAARPPSPPAAFRKPDTVAVLTARLLPAPLLLGIQVRTRVLNGQLADDFHRWYPGFTRDQIPQGSRRSLPRFARSPTCFDCYRCNE